MICAFGVHLLSQRQPVAAKAILSGPFAHFRVWWSRAGGFDRKWILGCATAFAVSVLAWLIFAGEQSSLVAYLQKVGFPDENFARKIAAFSLSQLGWFVGLFAVALVLVTLAVIGFFSGTRAKLGVILLGAFLLFDLGRADLPFIIHWDYKEKYEVGALNPIVKFLADKPFEHRVAGLPFRAPEGYELLDQVYRIEWMQHHFLYYNIQCLDPIQRPRMAVDLKMYLESLTPHEPGTESLLARRWELSNTRYLLGPADYLQLLNQMLDPEKHRFRIAERFEIVPKPGVTRAMRLEQVTAVANENGRYALFEFTGALPRVKLYGNWEVNTSDTNVLKTLADLKFDPAQKVLISTPAKNLPSVSTNENTGTVVFASYSPKKITFQTDAPMPEVMLLNDKHDPNWTVTVDGKPAELLRCNFFMRGVYLQKGPHTVEFNFELPHGPLYITIAGMAVGILLGAYLIAAARKNKVAHP